MNFEFSFFVAPSVVTVFCCDTASRSRRSRAQKNTKTERISTMSEGGKKEEGGNDKSKVEQLLTDLLIGGGVGAIA